MDFSITQGSGGDVVAVYSSNNRTRWYVGMVAFVDDVNSYISYSIEDLCLTHHNDSLVIMVTCYIIVARLQKVTRKVFSLVSYKHVHSDDSNLIVIWCDGVNHR